MLVQQKRQKISFTLVYNRKNKLNRQGESLIQVKAYQNPKCRYFSTGIYITPKYWDNKNNQIKSGHPNEFVYTEKINSVIREMKTYENRMINRYGSFSLDRLHEYQNPEKEFKNFTDFYRFELDRPDITHSTKKSQQARLRNLEEFRQGKIYFEDLTYSFIIRFDRFLRNKYDQEKSTIPNIHKTVKAYINKAIKQDLLKPDKTPYRKFDIKSKETDKVFLTENELNKIEDLVFTKDILHLEQVRDFFLLCCYTGLRYSDVSKLAPTHLIDSKNGLEVRITTQKNNKPAFIPISHLFLDKNGNSKPVALVEKLQLKIGGVHQDNKDIPFIKLSNQYVNRELKKIAVKSNISKKITAHVGRHTFATILCTKMPLPNIQTMLTHGHINTLMGYVHTNGALIIKAAKESKEKW